MVEARKRERAKPQRPDDLQNEEPSVMFVPAETTVPALREKHPRPSETVPAQVSPEDQIDFLKRLLTEEVELETQEKIEIPEETVEVLVFHLGQEKYGLDIQKIVQIIRFQEPTEVPHTVSFLDGIISLRGRMIPVINGRKRLNHEPVPPDKRTRIIVIRDKEEYQGILVDSANQVVRLMKKEIEPTPPVVLGAKAEFMEGVCEHKGKLIILLNLNRFLQLL